MVSRITTTQSSVVQNTEGSYLSGAVCTTSNEVVIPSHRVLIRASTQNTGRLDRHYILQVKAIQNLIKEETTSFIGLNTCGIIFAVIVSLGSITFCILASNGELFQHLGCSASGDCKTIQQFTMLVLIAVILLEVMFVILHIIGIVAIKKRSIVQLKICNILYLICFLFSIITANLCSCVMFGILFIQSDKLKLMLKELNEYQAQILDLNLV